VPNYWQKLRAHLLATQVKGVVHVVDELAVVPTHSLSDQQIADTLERTFERRLHEDVNSVHLTVKNGAVTLRGNVANEVTRRNICEISERTAGVTGVDCELTIPKT
jgi:osmotically-inducible protein OsmY